MVDAPETAVPEFLTVRELADLLRVKDRKVYDLAAAGEVPCSRVTGKLLFPEREIRAWIAGSRTGPTAAAPRPPVFLGSHDPLLEWALRQSRCGVASLLDGSLDGLSRFQAREGIAAGLHLHDVASDGWNVQAVATACAGGNAVLVAFAKRRRGLVMRDATAAGIAGMADLAGRCVVPRQSGSGAQTLFDQHLAAAGLAPDALELAEVARSEADAVLAVGEGSAEVAFGLELLARQHGLAFHPVAEERFDLLICRQAWFEPPLQQFMAFCRSPAFRERAQAVPGYDVSALGKVRWNA